MSLLNELKGNLSIFFMLHIALPGLKQVFQDERFKEIPVRTPPSVQAPPGILIGPPEMPIAMFKSIRVTYTADRYHLKFEGPLNEILEIKELIPELFEKQKYSLPDITRYCEFMTLAQPIGLRGAVDSIRSNVTVDKIDRLNTVCGDQMKIFRFMLSNLNTPLSDKWFTISLQPDINRPHDKMFVQIVKRTPNFGEMKLFLDKLENIFSVIQEMFSSA